MQVPGSRFLQGDFTTNETKAAMRKLLGGVPVDLRVESAIRGCATAQCLGQPVHTRLARAEACRVAGWPGGGTLRARASCTFTMNTAERTSVHAREG